MKHTFIFLTVVICFYLPVKGQEENLSEYRWSTIDAIGEVIGRHEDAIYLVGAMTGGYPKEPPMKNIWIYYPETDTSPDHNWVKLFNGENLDGWQVMCQEKDKEDSFWSFDKNKGAILCNSTGNKDHGYIWLLHEKEFDDFELRLKFMVSRESSGNSGVQIRSRYDKLAVVDDNGHAGWLDGPQVDIDPTNPWRNGFIYDETRKVKRWINPSLPDWRIDKETYAPKRVIFYWEDNETGWNDMTIICRGTHIKTIVNNIVVSDYDGAGVLDDKVHRKHDVGMTGQIALQLHKKSENRIWFKDIEIKELK